MLGNACDNCIIIVNPNQEDLDSDLRGDPCDNCVGTYNPFQDDWEDDGVGDACDNCYFDHNPSQSDLDTDFEGDHCDLDDGLIYVFFDSVNFVDCQLEAGFDNWNFYRGDLSVLKATCESGPCEYTQAPGSNDLAWRDCVVSDTWAPDSDDPEPGQAAYFLATGNVSGVESDLGQDSAGNAAERQSVSVESMSGGGGYWRGRGFSS